MKKTVLVITTSRADFGLLKPVITKLGGCKKFSVKVAATGNHFSKLHGLTSREIENEGIKINYRIPLRLTDDSCSSTAKAIGQGVKDFSKLYANLNPDLIIVLGDRYELWAACVPATIHRIPIAHIHGGEATFGAYDDAIRHSVSKMSSIHFTSLEIYRKRLIQMGEQPSRVHTVGALGIDTIYHQRLINREGLSKDLGLDLSKPLALMTYHPVTLEDFTVSEKEVKAILAALTKTPLNVLITMPNADPGGLSVFKIIKNFQKKYPKKFFIRKSLGHKRYLSLLQYCKVMVGNSSSGIIEAASFGVPVVNVGSRQEGRFKPKNVIDCDYKSVKTAISSALSSDFRSRIANLKNPYGSGNSADKIIRILSKTDFSVLLKKGFYDLS